MVFQAINAKLRAMRGEMLTYSDYESMSRADSVASIGSRLRERRSYRDVLTGLEGADVHREMLESRIPAALYKDYARIRLYIYDMTYNKYFAAYFLQYEYNSLKMLLRMVFDERDIPLNLPELEMLFSRNTKVDLPRLLAAKTVKGFIEQLRGTSVYTILTETYARTPTLFALEQQLDLHYYLHIWQMTAKLPDKENREVMKRIKGTEIDLRNIMWIYRLKHHYNMSGPSLYAYMIPINHRLQRTDVSRMVECGSEPEMLDIIAQGPYRGVFKDFTSPEHSYAHALLSLYAIEIKNHPNTLAAVTGYIYEKEQEINNITTVLEGIRYGLSAESIMTYLCI